MLLSAKNTLRKLSQPSAAENGKKIGTWQPTKFVIG